jgi:fructose-specific PTS system IIA-like component
MAVVTLEHRFTFGLANGLHARPASMLVEVVGRFKSNVTLLKICKEGAAGPAPKPVDARSVLSLVGLDVKKGDDCVLVVIGPDAQTAMAALRDLLANKLKEGDELPPPPAHAGDGTGRGLPMGLRNLRVGHALGRTVCAGIGMGQAVLYTGVVLPPELLAAKAGKPANEAMAALRAMSEVQVGLEQRAKEAPTATERELLTAHAAIAADPALYQLVTSETQAGATGLIAVARATEKLAAQLRLATSAYIRDRAIDVHDVGMQIMTVLGGGKFAPSAPALERDSVVFAESLTPNELLRMDRRRLKGLVLGRVGATSHTIILARSMNIPTLINVDNPLAVARAGDQVVVDANAHGGFVLAHLSAAAARYYERERRTQALRLERLAPLASGMAATRDGQRLEVGANASTPEEAALGAAGGADGVGLLRTELLFLDRAEAPSEEEQFRAYSAVLSGIASNAHGAPAPGASPVPRPVIIRAFDIGGDKPAAYIPMPKEENPFLGVRGLRLYEAQPKLLRTQLRAILRASALGPIKIMAPMVATPGEAAWFKGQVQAAQAELAAEGVAFDAKVPIGVMVEIPAAALACDLLAAHADFFSLGTNDLCQYFMAVDRGNRHPAMATLYNARQPAFLRLLRETVRTAKAAGRWIGVCGEMAGDEKNLPLMIGLGVDEISVAPGSVLALKRATSQADAARCRELLDAACACKDPKEVDAVLDSFAWRAAREFPVIDAVLIDAACDALTREEAIKAGSDLFSIAGRTDDPREVEDTTWARENTDSTAMGFGFAVPHCKSRTIAAPSLAVLKLQRPISWGEGGEVSLVFHLAVPANDTTGAHMRIFARLARKLMHDEFRERLAKANQPGEIESALREELGLDA